MVGFSIQAGCGDKTSVIFTSGLQKYQVTGKDLVLHHFNHIAHLSRNTSHKALCDTTKDSQTNLTFSICGFVCQLAV